LKRKILPCILVCCLWTLTIAEVSANGYWMPTEFGTLLGPIPGLGHKHMQKTTAHSREEFEFNWTTGIVAVNFHIMNAINYENWTTGQPWTGLVNHLNITEKAFSWETYGANATYHFIWYNPSLIGTNIIGDWHRSRWIEVESDIPGFPIETIAIGLALAMGLGIILHHNMKKQVSK
jgi:hypothetical protein